MKTPKCVCCFCYTVHSKRPTSNNLQFDNIFSYQEDTAKCLKNIAFIIIISKSHDKAYK